MEKCLLNWTSYQNYSHKVIKSSTWTKNSSRSTFFLASTDSRPVCVNFQFNFPANPNKSIDTANVSELLHPSVSLKAASVVPHTQSISISVGALREKWKLKNVHEAPGKLHRSEKHYLMEKHPMNFINRIIEYEQAFHAVMENLIIEGSFMSLALP